MGLLGVLGSCDIDCCDRTVSRRLLASNLLGVLQSNLHLLALFVQVDVRDVVPVEGHVLLAHRIRVKRLVHPVGTTATLR